MVIIKTYQWNGAWYALVELDDLSRIEFKRRQVDEPTQQEILTLAIAYQTAVAPIPVKLKAPTYPVSTINCQNLETVTVNQLITYLNNHSELYPVRVGDYLTATLNAFYKIERLDESARVELFNMTIGQLHEALKAAVANNPAVGTRPVVNVLKAEVDD